MDKWRRKGIISNRVYCLLNNLGLSISKCSAINFQPEVELTANSRKKGNLCIAKLPISFTESTNLNLVDWKRWTTKKFPLKSVDAPFEPSWLTRRVSTCLLESFTLLEQTCTRNSTFLQNMHDPNLQYNAMMPLGIPYNWSKNNINKM